MRWEGAQQGSQVRWTPSSSQASPNANACLSLSLSLVPGPTQTATSSTGQTKGPCVDRGETETTPRLPGIGSHQQLLPSSSQRAQLCYYPTLLDDTGDRNGSIFKVPSVMARPEGPKMKRQAQPQRLSPTPLRGAGGRDAEGTDLQGQKLRLGSLANVQPSRTSLGAREQLHQPEGRPAKRKESVRAVELGHRGP